MGVSVPESSGAPRPGLIRRKGVSESERGLVSTERLLPEWPIPGRLPPGEGGLFVEEGRYPLVGQHVDRPWTRTLRRRAEDRGGHE